MLVMMLVVCFRVQRVLVAVVVTMTMFVLMVIGVGLRLGLGLSNGRIPVPFYLRNILQYYMSGASGSVGGILRAEVVGQNTREATAGTAGADVALVGTPELTHASLRRHGWRGNDVTDEGMAHRIRADVLLGIVTETPEISRIEIAAHQIHRIEAVAAELSRAVTVTSPFPWVGRWSVDTQFSLFRRVRAFGGLSRWSGSRRMLLIL